MAKKSTAGRAEAKGQSDWTSRCSRRLMIGFHMADSDQIPSYASMEAAGLADPLLSHFEPHKFAQALREAHVQALWFYNKCHQGNCYYPSRVPGAHVHSALQGRDLFGELCAACAEEDIVPLCIYEFFDHRVITDHPDWCCRLANARRSSEFLGEEHRQANQNLKTGRPCLHGPYADFAIAQAVETVTKYPVRAYYVDFLGSLNFDHWICPWCNEAFRREFGFDFTGVENLNHGQYVRYLRWHYAQYDYLARRFVKELRAVRPDILFVHNSAHAMGCMPNLHTWELAAQNSDFLTGDLFAKSGTLQMSWAPRAFRAAGRLRPEVLVDSTHGSDRDNPKALDGFLAETWTCRAAGAAVCSSIFFRPDGSWNPACMALVRRAFAAQAACEPWLEEMQPITEVALIYSQPSADLTPRTHSSFGTMALHDLAFEGWAQILIQSHQLWDVLHDFQVDAAHLRRVKTVILPQAACLSDAAIAALLKFVRRGGRLIVTGNTATRNELARLRKHPAFDGVAGIKRGAGTDSNFREVLVTHKTLQPTHPWEADAFKLSLPPRMVATTPGTEVWAALINPLSGRMDERYVACVSQRLDRGRIVFWAADPAMEYRLLGIHSLCRVAEGTLKAVSPGSSSIRLQAPGTVEFFAHHQKNGKRWVITLINSVPGLSRSTTLLATIHGPNGPNSDAYRKIEEVGSMPQASGAVLTLRTPARKRIQSIYSVPDGIRLQCKTENNTHVIDLPPFEVQCMLAVEFL